MNPANLRTYTQYKDSGITWIGKIPFNWIPTRNKDIFSERGELSRSGNETLLTVSHITGVTKRSDKKVNMFMAETMEGYKLCNSGDMIINTMWAWMGALGTSFLNGICSPAYGVYAPHRDVPYNAKYFDYLYRTPQAISEMARNSKGIVSSRLRLYPKDFFQMQTALPSYKEQTAIANYLEHFTVNIDREIDLLDQKTIQYENLKKCLIDKSVTHGLDSSVQMADCGEKWIGEIPIEWKIMRFKDVAKMSTGNSLNDELKDLYSTPSFESTPYVSTKDINLPTCNLNIDNGVYIPNSERQYKKSLKHSTLLCIEGGSAGKKMAYVKKEVCYVNKLLSISNNDQVDSLFLHYFIRSTPFSSKFKTCLTGLKDNFWGVTGPQISRFKIPIPPIEEQQKIANYIDDEVGKIDCTVQTINLKIDKLKELRVSMISEITTGKIKVNSEEPINE